MPDLWDRFPDADAGAGDVWNQFPDASSADDLIPPPPKDEHIPEKRAIANYDAATTRTGRAVDDLHRGALGVLEGVAVSELRRGTGGGGQPESPMLDLARAFAGRNSPQRQTQLATELADIRAEGQSIPRRPVLNQLGKAEGFGEAIQTIGRDPLGAAAGTALESAPAMIPALLAGAILPPAGAAVMGATSGSQELNHGVLEFMQRRGVDLNDPAAIEAAFADPALLQDAERHGLTRGLIIGTIDALSGGLASRTLVPKAVVKGAVAREAANMPVQMGVQAAAGGGGEAAAQLATEGAITSPGDVIAEMIGETATAPAEVAAFGVQRGVEGVRARREQRLLDAIRQALAEEDAASAQQVEQPSIPEPQVQPPPAPAAPAPQPIAAQQVPETQVQPAAEAPASASPPAQLSGTPDVVDPAAEAQAASAPTPSALQEVRAQLAGAPEITDAPQSEVEGTPGNIEASAVVDEAGAELAAGPEAAGAQAARAGKTKFAKGPLSAHADRPVGRSFYTRVFEEAGLDPAEAELMPADQQFEVVSKELSRKYGFRSIDKQVGHNWREAIDAGMDAHQNMQSMAAALGIPMKAVSLNGKVDLSFTRGGDGALAWHMGLGPKGSRIAVSRRNHSFAHEWMHGLDHDLLQRSGARNMELVTGRLFTGKVRRGLDVSRTEPTLVEAVGNVLHVMYKDDAAKAALVRTLELRIENETDPKALAVLKKQLSAARRNQPPESSFYQGATALDKGKFQTPENGSDKGYWQRPTEMWARAGEAYIARNIERMGGGTSFLTLRDQQYLQDSVDFIKKAYPQKGDRERIFAAFDELFATINNLQIFGTEKAPAPTRDNVTFDSLDPRLWSASAKVDPWAGMPYYKRVINELGDLVKNEADATKRDADEVRNRLSNTKAALDEPMMRYIERLLASSMYSGRGTLLFLKQVYPKSQAINELFRKLITRPGTGEFTGRTYEEAVNLYVGQKGNVFQRIVHKYDLGTTTEAELRALRDMLTGVRTTGPTRLLHAARDIRFLLDQMWYDIEQAGIEIGYTREGHLPRLYDHAAIERDPQRFLTLAAQVYELLFADIKDPQQRTAKAVEAAADWLKRIRTGHLDNFDRNGIASSMTKGRKLPAEADALLADFMILDPLELVQTYTLQAARRIAWAERFGADNGGLNKLIDQMAEEGLRSEDIQLARSVVEIATGQRKSDLPRPLQGFLAWVHAIGTVALLPRAVLSSIAEPATAGLRAADVRASFSAFARTTATIARTAEGREQRELAEFLGVISDTLTDQMLANRFGGAFHDPQGATRLLGRFFHRTGLHALTNAQRAGTIPIADAYLRSWARRIAESKGAAGAVLAELGINPSQTQAFADWLLELERRPTVEDLEAAPPLMRDLYTTAINRFVDESIQNPKAVDRPMMAHNPIGRLIFGITSFLWAFQRNVILRTANLGKAALTGKYGGHALTTRERTLSFGVGLIPPLTTLIAMHLAVSIMREALFNPERFEDQGDDFWDRALSGEMVWLGISRAGVFGAFDPILNAYQGLRYQRDLSNVLIGAVPGYFLQAIQRMTQPLARNSSTTNMGEYNQVKGLYQLAVAPAINTALSWAPGGPLARVAYGGAMMTLTSPGAADTAAEAVVGPKGTKRELTAAERRDKRQAKRQEARER